MMLRAPFFLLVSCAVLISAPVARAQGGDSESGENSESAVARLQVKISELEERIRKMQGGIEQISFENKQLKSQMEKSDSDTEFRLNTLEKKQSATQAGGSQASDSGKLQPVGQVSESAGATEAPLPRFANSHEHYSYAFKLLNQTKYQEAGNAFSVFTKVYPKDPLIGNAWYWLGETWYVRRDYIRAADDFRLGYEAMPTGPKAADNLLKLALSLNALKKDKEACVILKQVVVKFGGASNSMKLRAEQEMNALGCNK
jgi:tol-pal system protein YbgF